MITSKNELRSTSITVIFDKDRTQTHGQKTLEAVREWLTAEGFAIQSGAVIESNARVLEDAFRDLGSETALWVVCGATGIGPSDIAPQMLARLSDFAVPGIGELLRAESLKFSTNSPLSRCGGYVSKGRFILSIPGNQKAALEQLGIIKNILPGVMDSVAGKCKSRSLK